jgi:dTDP-4-amino-4,6-dideoxygalactose transaminase
MVKKRLEICRSYREFLLPEFPYLKPYWNENVIWSHVPFLTASRNRLEEYLLKRHIDIEKYFNYCIPELSGYKSEHNAPRAKRLSERIINLPINVNMEREDVRRIADEISNFQENEKSKQ